VLRKYEAMCVFRADPETFKQGVEAVREELKKAGAAIEREEDMGQRTLAYPIKKELQGHYFYFVVEVEPSVAHGIENEMRLKTELLRFMMVRQEE
jgi:small subunit ribosomal protein S6